MFAVVVSFIVDVVPMEADTIAEHYIWVRLRQPKGEFRLIRLLQSILRVLHIHFLDLDLSIANKEGAHACYYI